MPPIHMPSPFLRLRLLFRYVRCMGRISWEFNPVTKIFPLEEYEKSRPPRRASYEMAIPRSVRHSMLRQEWDVPQSQIAAAIRNTVRIKNQRRITCTRTRTAARMDEVVELTKRKFKKVFLGQSVSQQVAELEQEFDKVMRLRFQMWEGDQSRKGGIDGSTDRAGSCCLNEDSDPRTSLNSPRLAMVVSALDSLSDASSSQYQESEEPIVAQDMLVRNMENKTTGRPLIELKDSLTTLPPSQALVLLNAEIAETADIIEQININQATEKLVSQQVSYRKVNDISEDKKEDVTEEMLADSVHVSFEVEELSSGYKSEELTMPVVSNNPGENGLKANCDFAPSSNYSRNSSILPSHKARPDFEEEKSSKSAKRIEHFRSTSLEL